MRGASSCSGRRSCRNWSASPTASSCSTGAGWHSSWTGPPPATTRSCRPSTPASRSSRPRRNRGGRAMIRRAFTMRLKPGGLDEYRRHHDQIWPELVAEIERQGIAQITIFENDPVLFLYSEISDEEAWDRLWHSAI